MKSRYLSYLSMSDEPTPFLTSSSPLTRCSFRSYPPSPRMLLFYQNHHILQLSRPEVMIYTVL